MKKNTKQLLENEILFRNSQNEISDDKPDPIMVAKKYNDEYISLVCSLFSYGNVKAIIKFLNSLDFNLLNCTEDNIQSSLCKHYYRFQNSKDIIALFIALRRMKKETSIEDIFYQEYKKEENIIDGLKAFIQKLKTINDYSSRGYSHLIGKVPTNIKSSSAYKRYMMYLRWMIRDDFIDMGLWNKIDKKDLLVALDVHSFNTATTLGLLKRKTCDLQAVAEVTSNLKKFDPLDPTKYEFALYRLGQEKIL